jgi:hypothetical protein
MPKKIFRVVAFVPVNLSSKETQRKNNYVISAVHVSCLVSDLQKPSSPEIEPRIVAGSDLLPEPNNSALGTLLLSRLVSEQKKKHICRESNLRHFHLAVFYNLDNKLSGSIKFNKLLNQPGFSIKSLLHGVD